LFLLTPRSPRNKLPGRYRSENSTMPGMEQRRRLSNKLFDAGLWILSFTILRRSWPTQSREPRGRSYHVFSGSTVQEIVPAPGLELDEAGEVGGVPPANSPSRPGFPHKCWSLMRRFQHLPELCHHPGGRWSRKGFCQGLSLYLLSWSGCRLGWIEKKVGMGFSQQREDAVSPSLPPYASTSTVHAERVPLS
jgi:hypothetical protein